MLVSLLASCLLIFSPKVPAQRDNQIAPQGAVPDPCLFPDPPSYCEPAPTPTPTPLPKDERKGLVLGPASVLREEAIMKEQDLRGPTNRKSNIEIVNETGTGYVRLWVDMGALQPTRSSTNNIRTNSLTKPLIESLDGQIIEARENGLKVILTVNHSYPTWVVWYRGNSRPSGTCDDEINKARKICQRMPEELDERSPWGQFIGFLVREYGFTKDKTTPGYLDYNRYIDVLEIVNEPNLTHRSPAKRTNGGRLVIALNVADMFETAQKIVRGRNNTLRGTGQLDAGATTIILGGPATADTLRGGRLTNYQEFIEELLLALKRRAFVAGADFVWTHHNYKDIEEQRNCAPGESSCARTPHCPDYDAKQRAQKALSKINSAAWVEKTLDEGFGGYRWRGMRDTDGNPAIFLTEGGVRLDQVINIYWCYIGLPQPVEPKLCRCSTNIGQPFPCRKAPKDPLGGKCIVESDNPDYIAFVQAVKAKMREIKDWQAGLVESSFNRMSQGALSKGVLLFTNYLTYTDPVYDTGMFDFVGTCADWDSNPRTSRNICTGENGSERPLFGKWKSLRTP